MIALVAITIVGALSTWLVPQFVSEDKIIEVTDKTTKFDGSRSRYLIFDNADVYEITDAVYIVGADAGTARFNSSDIYGSLKIGESYNIHTVGIRVPLLSWYPNILSAEPIPQDGSSEQT